MDHLEMNEPFWIAVVVVAQALDFDPSLGALQSMYIMGGEL
jgi:hypothetical protein